LPIAAQAQQPAFPGAEGAGMHTSGGRGTSTVATTVFEVTNLNDDNLPGSLRYALGTTATYRTVVFRVSGTIHLNSKLNIRANTTIAGQTAPGDGICLADFPVVISGDNVIVRYMRFRMGDKNQKKVDGAGNPVDGSGGDDAFGALGPNNLIIDHCSVSWSSDEAMTIYRGDNLTIQWCFISEPLNYSYHFETGDADYEMHGYNGIQGGKNASIHHNLYADARNRNPRFSGISTYTPSSIGVENVDFYNNVIYNWGINTVYGGEGGNYNVMNNYYKYGPNTGTGVRYRICNPSFSGTMPNPTIPWGKWYVNGNFVDGSTQNTNNNWSGVEMGTTAADTVQAKVNTAFNLGFTKNAQSALDAFDTVLLSAGATLPRRDTLDQRIVNDVRNRTGRHIDVQGGYPHGTAYSLTVNAWPTLHSTTAPTDTDHDGMPDSWETSHGLNLNDAADRNVYDGNGYTVLENYLNGITASNPGNPSPPPAGTRAVVAKDGSGYYTSIQAAIDAAPTGLTAPYKIYIRKGKYMEAVTIPSNKPFIQLMGENLAETIISYDNYSGKVNPAGGTYGTSTCGTVIINASDVMLMNLSIENATGYGINANAVVPAPGDGPQAVAVYTTSDRVVFYNCRMNGGQDTYYGGNVKATRCYFKNCYVDGNTDFLFGSSTIIFDTCIIYPRTRLDNQTGGYVTAVNTKLESGYGYVFRDCKITKNRGFTLYSLGRPWQNDGSTADAVKSRNKTVFLNTLMGSTITPAGWSTWDVGTNTGFITYGEYNSKNYNGTAVNVSSRVAWSKQLTAADAVKYYNNDTVFMNANTPMMAQWDPFATWPELNTAFKPELSVSNLIAKKGTSTTSLTWNLSWPMTGITCELYRSNDKTNFTLINSQVSTEDSACNFTFSENIPPPGQTYYYIVRASKSGYTSITSDTTSAVSTPTITVTGTLGSFLQGLGKASKTQSYIVAGANLVNNLTITSPAGYQVSIDNTNWFGNSAPLSITPANGAVANTTVYVRLNGATTGSFNGNIVNASTNATPVNVAVGGTIQADPLADGILLEQWPLIKDNVDDATVRAAGIVGTTPALNKLVLSNGTTEPTVPAYSTLHGQAYGVTADGSWTTASGGPGGTLSRQFYEEFTVVVAATHTMRLDSIILSTSFYNTSSGTKMAVVYSKTGFRSDSTEISVGAKNGAPLTGTASGNFTNAFDVSNQTGGNPDVFALVLNGSVGVPVRSGDTLSFRIYYCTGSGSPGRYVKVKNVIVKGTVTKNVVIPVMATSGILQPFSQTVGKPTDAQTFMLNATKLDGQVTIIPPAGYELSVDTGKTWNTTNIVLPPNVNNALSAQVMVRLNALAAGPYEGAVQIQAAGSAGITVPVTGVAYSPYNISPNPAHNYVNIYHTKLYTQANIRIYNLNGHLVKIVRTKRATNVTTINISDLTNGIYFVVVERLNEKVLLRFIKQL
jgi:pectin methylesterase-like acyl-CoA thioesterase